MADEASCSQGLGIRGSSVQSSVLQGSGGGGLGVRGCWEQSGPAALWVAGGGGGGGQEGEAGRSRSTVPQRQFSSALGYRLTSSSANAHFCKMPSCTGRSNLNTYCTSTNTTVPPLIVYFCKFKSIGSSAVLPKVTFENPVKYRKDVNVPTYNHRLIGRNKMAPLSLFSVSPSLSLSVSLSLSRSLCVSTFSHSI